jgi:predicted cupin superfamily sugar epimerase
MSLVASAAEIIKALGLKAHPEGGWYRETFRDQPDERGRAASTAILYLLDQGQVSAWHRVRDAAEVWHFHAGDPLELSVAPPEGPATTHRLGPDVLGGQTPQVVVPRGWWQSARPLGAWTLVGCTVAPGFVFEAFELAPEVWEPPSA